MVPNPDQIDTDGDGQGDACDIDDDNDTLNDVDDPCRTVANDPVSGDLIGASECPFDDPDQDGVPTSEDNCPFFSNPMVEGAQPDLDGDGLGDVCDLDIDNDEILNSQDNCASTFNPSQIDVDRDGLGDGGFGGAAGCDPKECYVVPGVGNESCLIRPAPLT
ncbi:MAG: thrombospondin type 3 repeat-containing protein [Myxococcota bacterium]